MGWGASFGATIPDSGCAARLDARTLWSFGLKKAAIARLCLTPDILKSMPEVCAQYQPQPDVASAAYASAPPVRLQESIPQEYDGGPVEVVERRTGALRLCRDYDVTRSRCRAWAGR